MVLAGMQRREILKYLNMMLLVAMLTACSRSESTRPDADQRAPGVENPVYHFEIPVTDMDRAVRFYQSVFGYELTEQTVDGYQMAFFPRADGKPGASGALAKGDVYVPSTAGAIIYFDVPDIDVVLERAMAQGAKVLYPKKHIGDAGYVAELLDSEGNRIALTAVTD
jgi:predicted enzyme related to lactoylglutathione lyase